MMPTSPNILDKIEHVNISAFIIKHGIKTENGLPLNFHDFRFLLQVYADNSPLICAMKAAQIGFTTYEILKSLFEAKNSNIDIIYVLPTGDDVKQFSGGKTNRIIANNPILQTWTADKDSVEQKRVGKATIYYRGSWTERVALMISAKKLIVDELDRCKQDVIEQYDSRLQAVNDARKAFFSNPSIPNFGIDKLYHQSDQKVWHITHACGAKFPFYENCIDYEAEMYRCPNCRLEITDDERRMGSWVATSQGKWSGYWIPLWITPWTSAKKIAEYKREKTGEYFSNFVAGQAYLGGGDKVNATTIINCLSDKVNTHSERIIIGVDTGLPIHIVCANKEGYFYYDTLSMPGVREDPYKELEDLMIRWPKSIVVADQGGDLIGIRKLQAHYPGRVFLVWYRRDKKGIEMIDWGKDEEYGKVTADRNRLIQLFIDEMLDRRVVFNGTESEWQEYIAHWLNIYRVWVPMAGEADDSSRKEFRWERNGADHYVHASCYCRIGLSKYLDTQAKIVGGKDVWGDTPKESGFGYKARMNKEVSMEQSPIGVQLGERVDL